MGTFSMLMLNELLRTLRADIKYDFDRYIIETGYDYVDHETLANYLLYCNGKKIDPTISGYEEYCSCIFQQEMDDDAYDY